MEEYKFRVWNILHKRMREWGDIFHLPAWEIFPGTPKQRCYEVMQYTGIKDMDGKEIYEDDLIMFQDETAENFFNNKIGKVVFEEAAFWIEYFDGTSIPLGGGTENYKVLGNIYENSELLPKLSR